MNDDTNSALFILTFAAECAHEWFGQRVDDRRWTDSAPDCDVDAAEQELGRPMDDDEAFSFNNEFRRIYNQLADAAFFEA